jgi:chitin synthase
MFTSFIQYILLTPTYINVLNIYAFCNTHDITWGTKGDDKAEKLPSATLKPGGKVDVNIPQDDGDLNAQYEAELAKFAIKPPKEVQVISEEDRQADYYKGFRSAVVLAWVFCNFALGAVVLSAAGLETFDTTSTTDGTSTDETQNERSLIYMEVVLWSVAALSMFKFLGAMWYLVVRMVSSLPLPYFRNLKNTANPFLVPRCLISFSNMCFIQPFRFHLALQYIPPR